MCSGRMINTLKNKRAQILLPSVLLAPIFILVIYLLFETAKVSMTKIRQQFALDNAAYSQMTSASSYLNAVAMSNGPLAYRVVSYYAEKTPKLIAKEGTGLPEIVIFEMFYKAGAVPVINTADQETGENAKPPKPESDDWGIKYYPNTRPSWEKETPGNPPEEEGEVVMTSKDLADKYHFSTHLIAVPVIVQYLSTYAQLGTIYDSQEYVYKELTKNAKTFREVYYANVSDCKLSQCASESARTINRFTVQTKKMELDKMRFYVSDSDGPGTPHGGAHSVSIGAVETLNGSKLFQFAYLDPSSRGRLRNMGQGILLKQRFKLPKNNFNINLENKYKPYVRTRVSVTCPRSNNNCVWPNPLPKYSVTLDP